MSFTHLLLSILLSSQSVIARAVDPTCFDFDPRHTEMKKIAECTQDPETGKELLAHTKGVLSIVTNLKLYPVYTSVGKFVKFIKVAGKFRKGLVLVKKTDGPVSESYATFEGFEVFESNHYRADLQCFVDHALASVPDEKMILDCIDAKIQEAKERFGVKKVRSFSFTKLHMVFEESKSLFDTGAACAGGGKIVFFQGKVYNSGDFGNFIWGAIMEELKVSDFTKKAGSTLNGYLGSGGQNHGFLKSTHILGDHPRDQVAIFDGSRWMKRVHKKIRSEER